MFSSFLAKIREIYAYKKFFDEFLKNYNVIILIDHRLIKNLADFSLTETATAKAWVKKYSMIAYQFWRKSLKKYFSCFVSCIFYIHKIEIESKINFFQFYFLIQVIFFTFITEKSLINFILVIKLYYFPSIYFCLIFEIHKKEIYP